MKTTYDQQYKDAYQAAREAQQAVHTIEIAMAVERGVPEGPLGTYNRRKYIPLRKHIDNLRNDAIGYTGYRP